MTAPLDDHPEELLPWYVNGTVSGEERRCVETHLASCLVCRREVDELEELRREVKATAAPPPGEAGLARLLRQVEGEGEGGQPRQGWWRPWSLAAAAMIAVAVSGLVLWRPDQTPAPVEYREDEGPAIRALVGLREALPRGRFLLRWEVVPNLDGARFDVRVTTESLDSLFHLRGVSEPEILVPAAALVDLPPGAKVYWQVEAVSPAGDRLRSPTFRVAVE